MAETLSPVSEEVKVSQPDMDEEQLTLLKSRANKALNSIRKGDITELKSLKSPPEEVKRVMTGIILLLTGQKVASW